MERASGETRLKYHFQPQRGWMNDPNGLIYFHGQYHIFYQHYPYAPHWGQMHWGHAISDDLIHWKELPIALYPDQEYEDDGGCFSGSAIEKDGRLYLFYTSVSHRQKQTQSVAYSDDGVNFVKYPGNPVIRENPFGNDNFRDPKVTYIDGRYYMVVGTGDASCGKVLLYTSSDLLHWTYVNVLFEGSQFADCIECPDFFKLQDKYVLMFSKINEKEKAVYFAVGDFAEGRLVNYTLSNPEWGIDFYAPQTFPENNRRIMIGWMYHWGRETPENRDYAGALTIPRELTLSEKGIRNFPVAEAEDLLKEESEFLKVEENALILQDRKGNKRKVAISDIQQIHILEDTQSMEVFVNYGLNSFTWLLE